MAHLDNNIQPNSATLLQDILRLIAKSPDLNDVAQTVLQESRRLTGANAGFLLLFEDPHVLIADQISPEVVPQATQLRSYTRRLSYDIHISNNLPSALATQYVGWLIVPLMYRQAVAGVFCLLYQTEIHLSEEESNTLISLIDALSIVAHSVKSESRHEKLNHNQNEFVRVVSHDLRSPLASMKGFASMLEAQMVGELNERQAYYVEKILIGIEQMTSLVDNIQDAGRYDPENGFYQLQRSPSDLIDIVHDIVEKQIVPAEKDDIHLTVRTSDDIPIVNVDANMLERSIINLVDNAIKYTPNGGTVEVGVMRKDDAIVITVSDDGYGISEENLKSLFQRHFRIRRKEHKRIKGSGLGLFIVRSVAVQHGGEAFVTSTEGEGSTFGIRIPLTGDNLLSGSREQPE